MPETRVQDEQGNIHVFPDGATPEMIAQALNVKPPSSGPTLTNQAPQQPGFSTMFGRTMGAPTSPEEAGGMLMGKSGDIEGASDSAYNPRGGVNLPGGFNPGNAARNVFTNVGQSIADRIKSGSQQFGEAAQNIKAGGPILSNIGKGLSGYTDIISATNPVVNAGGESGKQFAEGNIPGGLGAFTAGMIQGGAMGRGIDKPTAPLERPISPPSPTELFQKMRPTGPQAYISAKARALSPKAVVAAEDIFRAAAPTGTNVKFRENLYTALPDLAEVARKVNLDEAKGGIINPDMRVNATVKAIDAHLSEMYKTEREPQIEPYKNTPVSAKLDYDAKNGLRYLVKNAGQVGDRFLAAKALNGDQMTAGGLNRLAIVTNEELTPLRSMTPQERMTANLTNKKLAGLTSLDKGLSSNLNDFLQSQGEPGLRGYEQRYAALSDVRNGLRPRINAEELKRDFDLGLVGKGIKAFTGGKTGIASASQAAVADINVGRKLQSAMKVLAESDMKPNRAIRRVSPTSSQPVPSQQQ